VPVESLDHTADVRLRAWGRSFQGTLLELSNYMLRMIYSDIIRPEVLLSSTIEYDTDEGCVTRLLNDLIYRSESAQLAIKIRKLLFVMESQMGWYGEPFSKKKRGSILVKAATYDRLIVKRTPALIEVTLDI